MLTAAFVYCRFSPRPNAAECDSIEKQEERCLAYCRKKRYTYCGTYSDPDTSGGVLDRPGLSRAIQEIKEGPSGTVLVVDSVNRLARDMLVSLTIRHEVEKAGGRIEFADGTPVADTPEGRLFSNILSAFAAYERDRIRFATSRGIKRRQANGEWFGRPPVGWMRDPEDSKRLVPNPIEQCAVYEILEASATLTSQQIAECLNGKGDRFRGRPWSGRTIRRILAQEKEKVAPEES